MDLPAHGDLSQAVALHQRGRQEAAAQMYRAVLAQDPDNADAHHLLGAILDAQGDEATAESHIRRAIDLHPAGLFLHRLGLLLVRRGRLAEALETLEKAVTLSPDDADIHLSLGNVLHRLRRPEAAADAYHRALALAPLSAEVHSDLGTLLMDVGRQDEAITRFARAIQCCPSHAPAHGNLGLALERSGRLSEAAAAFTTALHFRQDPVILCNLANNRKEQGDIDGAIAGYREVLAKHPNHVMADSNLQMTLHYSSRVGLADFQAAARDWAAQQAPGLSDSPPPARPPLQGRALRVGYVSGDFKSHPVGYFIESVLAARDRTQVHVTCYCNNDRHDALTDRLRASADRWVDIAALDDDAAAARIRQDGIDILVDLSGHTDRNRLLLFTRRPAPVQATWLGYFGTTGVPGIDWVLADRTVLPPQEQPFYTEKVCYLPDSYLCFTPPDDAPDVAPTPVIQTGSLTFGSFHNRAKITPETVVLWSRTLLAIPHARLFLKSRQFDDIGVRQELRAQFEAHGVAPARLRFEGRSDRGRYLQTYALVDIVLDSVPFGGGTTTAEALWMGVPTLTLRGDRWAGRIGQSFLRVLGLEERLVAADAADFVAKAAALAGDPDALNALRMGLRARMRRSSLCDAAAFARGLEAAYRGLWDAGV